MGKRILILNVLIILLFSTIIPMTIGYNSKIIINEESQDVKNINIDKMNQVWPLHKNDPQHTGRSIYDTSQNKGGEKWKYLVDHNLEKTIVIDKDGVLYTISWDGDLYAVYPNETMKWKKDLNSWYISTPAIGPDGTIYIGAGEKFYSFYPNGTQMWDLDLQSFYCDPVIDSNGIIYISTNSKSVCTVYPNGTIRWEYKINGSFIGGPAVDKDGDVYFTDRREYVYCLNSDGSFKWSYRKVNMRNDPVIGDDGIIYIVADGLNALYPNGTLKWYIEYWDWHGFPSITHDGKIIISGSGDYVTALNPTDGSIIWQYKISDNSQTNDVSNAVISGDGTIYFAYTAYSDDVAFLCALNPDGSLKWETYLNTDIQPDYVYVVADPSIGSDGTVYIASSFGRSGSNLTSFGYINAIGKDNAITPKPPTISGPSHVGFFINYEYIIRCNLPPGQNVYYLIDWDDQLDYTLYSNNWIGPYSSEEEVKLVHYWEVWGVDNSNVKVMVRSEDNLCSQWTYFKVTIPRTIGLSNLSFLKILDHFPILQKLLQRLG